VMLRSDAITRDTPGSTPINCERVDQISDPDQAFSSKG